MRILVTLILLLIIDFIFQAAFISMVSFIHRRHFLFCQRLWNCWQQRDATPRRRHDRRWPMGGSYSAFPRPWSHRSRGRSDQPIDGTKIGADGPRVECLAHPFTSKRKQIFKKVELTFGSTFLISYWLSICILRAPKSWS